MSALLQSLPKIVDSTYVVTLAAGSASGFTYAGGAGSGRLVIEGTWSAVTPTTGVASGAAGSGTSATSLVKPTGAANWTANDLRGKFVRITSGTADGVVRPILSNTTTAIAIHAATGLAEGDSFEVVTPGTDLGEVTLKSNTVDIEFRYIKLERVVSRFGATLYLTGCEIDTSNDDGSIDVLGGEIYADSCKLVTNGSIIADAPIKASVVNTLAHDGSVTIRGAAWVVTEIEAYACDQTALKLEQVIRGQVGFNAKSCTYTPLHLVSVHHCEPYGTGIAGSSNAGSFGIIVESGGWVDLIDNTTLAGTSDIEIQGVTYSYANIASNGGTVWNDGTTVKAATGTGVWSNNWFTIAQDVIVSGSTLWYSFVRRNGASISAAGSDLAGATALGGNLTYVSGGTGGVKIGYAPTAMGAAPREFTCINRSGSTITLYPDTVSTTINGGSAGAGVSLDNGQRAEIVSTSSTNWSVTVFG